MTCAHRFSRAQRLPSLVTLCLILFSAFLPKATAQALYLSEVLSSVKKQYPPFLAALIEQDIMDGRAQQAIGSFDTIYHAGGSFNPAGYYDGQSAFTGIEKPLSSWGGSIYGGYRISSGYLPNYSKDRTGHDGEALIGFKIPLLRDGSIDRRRASLSQAQIDQELAKPFIHRQSIDFIRAATFSYYQWLSAGLRLNTTQELLRIAKNRDSAIAEQVKSGASAPIIQIDNQRLVVSREIAVIQAQRRFQAASIELSLFHRTRSDAQPIVTPISRLPQSFPNTAQPESKRLNTDLSYALSHRPEIQRIKLSMDKFKIDEKLANNNLLPNLDVGVQANHGNGDKDIEPTEIEAKIELKLPLERNEARGRLSSITAQIQRLQHEQTFTRNRIEAEIKDAHSAILTAYQLIAQTELNVKLASQLESAENERFRQGATDLLALQIREQATFDAKLNHIEAQAEFFRALANYRAAVGSTP